MNRSKPTSLSIEVEIQTHSPQKSFYYQPKANSPEPCLEQGLFPHFKDLKLEPNTKRRLNLENRKKIFIFQNSTFNWKSKDMQSIEKMLNEGNIKKIKARELGGLALLHLLNSQKDIPKDIEVDLLDCPLALFPKKNLNQLKRKNWKVASIIADDSWLSGLNELYHVNGELVANTTSSETKKVA